MFICLCLSNLNLAVLVRLSDLKTFQSSDFPLLARCLPISILGPTQVIISATANRRLLKTFPLHVQTDCTVTELRDRISAECEYDMEYFNLYFESDKLVEGNLLSFYGVTDLCQIDMLRNRVPTSTDASASIQAPQEQAHVVLQALPSLPVVLEDSSIPSVALQASLPTSALVQLIMDNVTKPDVGVDEIDILVRSVHNGGFCHPDLSLPLYDPTNFNQEEVSTPETLQAPSTPSPLTAALPTPSTPSTATVAHHAPPTPTVASSTLTGSPVKFIDMLGSASSKVSVLWNFVCTM